MPLQDLFAEALSDAIIIRLFTYPGAFVFWATKGFKGSCREVLKQRNGLLLFLLGCAFHTLLVALVLLVFV